MASYQKSIEQAKQFWATRTGRQKAILLAGSGASALLLIAFVWMIGAPDNKPLYTGLDTDDAQNLAAQLDAQGIPHQTSADGKTISVPANKLDAARMQTASQGGPHSGRMGFELFDKMSWGQTEFDEKVEYQRALEGELERSIQTLADVERARVHLVMPTQSVFLDQQRGAKASVVLKLRRGTLSKPAVLAIARLVSGAVDNLRPEDVSIVDADNDRSLGLGRSMDGTDDTAGNELTARLISTLEPVVGVDKIRASVNVEYNQGTTEESQERYDPTVSAVLSEQKSQDQASGGAAAGGAAQGVPGTSSNIPAKTSKSSGEPAQPPIQTSTTQSTQYGVNKTLTHTVTPAGKIQRITAALLVDDQIVKTVQKGKVSYTRQKRTPEELNRIQELAKAAIGFDEKRGDSITVQNLSFEADPAGSEAPVTSWANTTQKAINDYASVLRPASILVLFVLGYFFLLRPFQKHALAADLAASAAAPQNALAGSQSMALAAPPAEKGEDTIRAAQLKEEALELMKQKPMHTARALQAWLREEPS